MIHEQKLLMHAKVSAVQRKGLQGETSYSLGLGTWGSGQGIQKNIFVGLHISDYFSKMESALW